MQFQRVAVMASHFRGRHSELLFELTHEILRVVVMEADGDRFDGVRTVEHHLPRLFELLRNDVL